MKKESRHQSLYQGMAGEENYANECFQQFYKRTYSSVYQSAKSGIFKTREDLVEKLVQGVYEKLWIERKKMKNLDDPARYIYDLIKKTGLEVLKKELDKDIESLNTTGQFHKRF